MNKNLTVCLSFPPPGVGPSTQPHPHPTSPPTRVQALYTQTEALISWGGPLLPPLAGKGAYAVWKYEVGEFFYFFNYVKA